VTSVTVRVPAKVNLQLSVGPPRDDGYHDLVNVFHAVSLFDEVTASGGLGGASVTVAVEGESAGAVPLDGENLAVKAAHALAARAGRPLGTRLLIRKAIPVAGGMAGGSADAAAALVACNELWGLGL
jgi:4-diphosphocytidyl-2-C-methyl-D-erythritol kinase